MALIFTMLMIPKTNERGLKKKKMKTKKKEKTRSALLLGSWGLGVLSPSTGTLGKSPPHCFKVRVHM